MSATDCNFAQLRNIAADIYQIRFLRMSNHRFMERILRCPFDGDVAKPDGMKQNS